MARRPFARIFVLIWADVLAAYAIWVMQTYLTDVWKIDFTRAAAIVNISTGAAMIMPIGMSYIAETCIGHFWVLLSSSICYSVGLGCLAMSTPPVLSKSTGTCSDYKPECIGHTQKILFYTSLALISVGIAGHVTSLGPFIIEQNQDDDDNDSEGGSKALICISTLAVILVPVAGAIALPYVKPWSVRFGVPAICTVVATLVFLSGSCFYTYMKPGGSSLTRVFRVFVASISKIHIRAPKDASRLYENHNLDDESVPHTKGLRCLDKAAVVLPSQTLEEQERNRWRLCRVTEVEETKITIRMVPIWMTFIVCGIVMSIGNTYFLEQANHMNPKVGKLKVPLPILLVFYDGAKSQAANVYYMLVFTFRESKRKYAPAIGFGIAMIFSILCCITAAKVETRRLDVIVKHGLLDKPDERIPMSIFWLVPQFLLLGLLDGFAENSISFFFNDQVPASMRGYMMFFANGVMGAGVTSSVLSVYLAGKISKRGGRPSWFQETLNRSRLDKYYWTLAVMSCVNLVLFIFVAIWYQYRESTMDEEDVPEEEETQAPYEDAHCCC